MRHISATPSPSAQRNLESAPVLPDETPLGLGNAEAGLFDLCLDRVVLLGALLEEPEFECIRMQNQPSRGGAGVWWPADRRTQNIVFLLIVLAIIALGAASNLAAIVANGGFMPVSADALAALGDRAQSR